MPLREPCNLFVDRYVSVDEACRILGCSRATFYRSTSDEQSFPNLPSI